MNGPGHYERAQECLDSSAQWARAEHFPFPQTGLLAEEKLALRMADLAEAQVHATLALAAALAGLDASEGPAGGSTLGRRPEDGNEWDRVLTP